MALTQLNEGTSLDRSIASIGSFSAKRTKKSEEIKAQKAIIEEEPEKLQEKVEQSEIFVDIGCVTQEGLYHDNEDRMCYGVNLNEQIDGFVGVFDGHGGQECASYVSTNLARYLVSVFSSVGAWKEGDTNMKQMFHNIEEEFVAIATEEQDTSGACATIMIAKGREALVANIGDCKAIAIPKQSEEYFMILTGDHRADAKEEMERIERAGGSVVEGRVANLQPSRSFGDIDVKEIVGDGVVIPTPEVSRISMEPGGFMIIATDGLWDIATDTEVIEIAKQALSKTDDVEEVAETLVQFASRNGSEDDITVSIVLWSDHDSEDEA